MNIQQERRATFNRPQIAVITTGGTIAARPTLSGEVVIAASSEELLDSVPEAGRVARVHVVELFRIDSSLRLRRTCWL
jgi:L-asparaginase